MKIDPTVGATTLIEFLEARLDEDEQAAREWYETDRPRAVRAIHEFEAKRRIIDLYRRSTVIVGMRDKDGNPAVAYSTATEPYLVALEIVAAVYDDHPDYRTEWAPDT